MRFLLLFVCTCVINIILRFLILCETVSRYRCNGFMMHDINLLQYACKIPNACLFEFAKIAIILKSHANIYITLRRFSFIDREICLGRTMALQLRILESKKPVSPAIIVLGSGLAVIPDPRIYLRETTRAIDEGYDLLIVSVY